MCLLTGIRLCMVIVDMYLTARVDVFASVCLLAPVDGDASCVWLCGSESAEGEGGAHRAALEGAGPGAIRGGQGCCTGG